MSIYGVATEAILMCYFVDKKLNEMGDETDNCPAPLYKFFKDNEYKGDNL
jgi:hypothetical protein